MIREINEDETTLDQLTETSAINNDDIFLLRNAGNEDLKASAETLLNYVAGGNVAPGEEKAPNGDKVAEAIATRQLAGDYATKSDLTPLATKAELEPLATKAELTPLASKEFVNSSVATNTANFINTFNSVEELEAYTGTLTNNDYAFVIATDDDGNTIYKRYKYNANNEEWQFEYILNNSSFTAEQWATIQSGITAESLAAALATKINKSDFILDGDTLTINLD